MRDLVIHCAGAKLARGAKPDLVLDIGLRGRGRTTTTVTLFEITHQMMAKVPDRLADLFDISCYVHCADRLVVRDKPEMPEGGANWRRTLHFLIAVRDPEFWNTPTINAMLCGTLGFLSGDRFSFDFVQQEGSIPRQDHLDLRGGGPAEEFRPEEIILFSGGLDSLAGAVDALLARRVPVVLASFQSANLVHSIQTRLAAALRERAGPTRLLHIGLGLTGAGEMTEPTQRTRSFLFACFGMVVAHLFGRRAVTFYENGIISTNLPIASHVLGTRATRTTHPRVLRDYATLFSRVMSSHIEVRNPFFWDTKADIVRRIAGAGCGDLIATSFSCASTRRATLSSGQHCGVCTQCLDRRFGILAAGCGDLEPASQYAVELFRGERQAGVEAVTAESYVLAAHRYARSSEAGFLGAHGEAFRALRYLGLTPGAAATRLHQLHVRHGEAVVSTLAAETARMTLADHLSLPDHSLLAMLQASGASDVQLRDPVEHEPGTDVQAERRRLRTVPRPLTFSIDASRGQVHIDGGIVLEKKHTAIIQSLLQAYQDGLRAGRGAAGHAFVRTPVLAADVGMSEESLRQHVRGLRLSLTEQSRSAFGVPLEPDDIIESRKFHGYRLNPHLRFGTSRREAVA
ncbi:7-cyano-7-deazaguanine synthase [Roseomonas xinghualingensis]|uniref:7-cyano-7-deazaguanine synthase n=1 Tax=Roseomonas xinghualingensis TaxID=2986475 RepID=UPI0021F20B0C|nr:7-cyano-7-deazaguanine synthase [Roseomonas sp. SXEYE001]MCV4210300.1 7-cyano-7-deazaguanine synthase [Roseomonas sp. SXEYE001]